MKKETQKTTNIMVEHEWTMAKERIDHKKGVRLRSCQAWVYTTPDYIFLCSYNTTVAFIDRRTWVGYDVLRLVYGYTATSVQHISKFFNEYNVKDVLHYRPI